MRCRVNWSPTRQAELRTKTLFHSQATMSVITWTLLAAPIHYAGLTSDTDSFTMGCVTMRKLLNVSEPQLPKV